MRNQYRMCMQARHSSVVSLVCDTIKKLEIERKIMLQNKQDITEIDKKIDNYMNITFEFGF